MSDNLNKCDQIKNIQNTDNINIRCSFETRKRDHGVGYKVRSTVTIKKSKDSKTAIVKVQNRLRDQTDHITEASYCEGDCVEQFTVNLRDLTDLQAVSQALSNQIAHVLEQENNDIENAVNQAYSLLQKKKILRERINKLRNQ